MAATSLMITHREMGHARDAGRTWPLSPAITDFTKYWGNWWISSADGWLRITDTVLASRLDIARARLSQPSAKNRRINKEETEESS